MFNRTPCKSVERRRKMVYSTYSCKLSISITLPWDLDNKGAKVYKIKNKVKKTIVFQSKISVKGIESLSQTITF